MKEVHLLLEPFRKVLLAALGVGVLTAEEIRSIVDGLVLQGDFTEEQARKVLDALLARKPREFEGLAARLGQDIRRLAGLLPVVSRGEFHDLEMRVRGLERLAGEAVDGSVLAPDEVAPTEPSAGGDS